MNKHSIDIFSRKETKRRWPIFLFIFLCIIGISAFGYYKITHLNIEDVFENNFVQNQLEEHVPEKYKGTVDFLPTLLGLHTPKTYLVLFHNDTELRPGGGFIGSYAVLQVSGGHVSILALEGSEVLDSRTPASWRPTPPDILKAELGVDRWYFRDSNWDPFFEPNAMRALSFYTMQGGVAGDNIDGVVMIDTAVLEEVLAITGPITVQGIEFTSDSIVEKLEYEVEYGYVNRGISVENRKQIMKPLFEEIVKKIGLSLITQPEQYIALVESLAAEKHVAVHFFDPEVQKEMYAAGLGDASVREPGDYLMWVDANLAALKTDHAMKRSLAYTIQQTDTGRAHIASMTYTHSGQFDWRTTRYRTYARVFVPLGSILDAIRITDSNGEETRVRPEAAVEAPYNGLTSFAYFFVVEPGETKTLSFIYRTPDQIVEEEGYTLSIPKQFGTYEHSLTLNLDFGKKITSASPAETKNEWGDTWYRMRDTLRTDKIFRVNF